MVQKNSINKKVIVIVGPTASGKSAFALECAKLFNGVIISADSMQVYKELSIGTANPTQEELKIVEHRLVGTHSLLTPFSAGEFVKLAKQQIDSVLASGKLPIVVGGTGLFVQSLMYNYDFTAVKTDTELRQKYQGLLAQKGLPFLYEELKQKSPERASKVHPNDSHRITRALEVLESSAAFNPTQTKNTDYDFFVFATNLPREQLYQRINARVDQMLQQGLISEIEQLLQNGFEQKLLEIKAIGYKELLPYVQGSQKLETCVSLLKQKTRNYAKRQLTWFRAMPEIVWFNPKTEKKQILNQIQQIVRNNDQSKPTN